MFIKETTRYRRGTGLLSEMSITAKPTDDRLLVRPEVECADAAVTHNTIDYRNNAEFRTVV